MSFLTCLKAVFYRYIWKNNIESLFEDIFLSLRCCKEIFADPISCVMFKLEYKPLISKPVSLYISKKWVSNKDEISYNIMKIGLLFTETIILCMLGGVIDSLLQKEKHCMMK